MFIEENKKIKEKENEKRKNIDEKKEEILKLEEEKFSSLNDNFKFENFPELKYMDSISFGCYNKEKTVAVYCIIKNYERLYQMAYFKNESNPRIIIYNLILNKIENKIYTHDKNINILKYYYNSSEKNHILLSSSLYYYSSTYSIGIKLWNISSNPITNILKIDYDCDNIYIKYYNCLMFKNEEIFIFGNQNKKDYELGVYIWNKNGECIKK